MKDLVRMLEDMMNVFDSGDDVQTVDAICQKAKLVQRETTKRQEKLIALEDKLREQVEGAEAELRAADSEEVHRKRVAALEDQKQKIVSSITSMEEDYACKQEKLEALRAESERIAEKNSALLDQVREDVPRRKHTRSLYAAISNVKITSVKDKVAGYVASTDPPSLQPFRFSADGSPFKEVNSLWDLINGN